MADILIRGMEMSKEYGKCVVIFPDGRVTTEYGTQIIATAILLPEGHGRLIDADALLDDCCDVIEDHSGLDYIDPCPMWGYSADMIGHAPTIVPAEGGGKDG